ncbi:hypothetical protein KFL_000180320 [Klebsormidium nitens]|uniref:Uncharacterized protein n=1 Tax=Klebsormidium nitens TaxID=105231 RepID=A0A1Y1HNK4_KLENI|nr:hypothetical protein KFL_000180320 [Klebsormidium nitens]|eukprot:GAQ78749.1 hypothetical protein KFL_000180320 [Klebsormidium nitens]
MYTEHVTLVGTLVVEFVFQKNAPLDAMRVCWLISSVSGAFTGATAVFLALIHTVRRDRARWAVVVGLSFASNVFYILSLSFGAQRTEIMVAKSMENALFALNIVLFVVGSIYTTLLYLRLPDDDRSGRGVVATQIIRPRKRFRSVGV